jgi:diguanylate cyclase (GGDEF)-like protein/PAS domain S-box-containing protein
VASAGEWFGGVEKDFATQDREALARSSRFNRDLDRVQSILARSNDSLVRHITSKADFTSSQLTQAKTALDKVLSDAINTSLSGGANAPQFDELRTLSDKWFSDSASILARGARGSSPVLINDEDVVATSATLDSLHGLCAQLRLTEDTLSAANVGTEDSHASAWLARISIEAVSFLVLCAVYIYVTSQYVRRLRQVEAKLKAALPYRSFIDNLPAPVLVFDEASQCFIGTNLAAQTKYGYSREEFEGLGMSDIRDASESARSLEWWATSDYKAGQPVDGGTWAHRRKNGSSFKAWIHLVRTRVDGRAVSLMVVADLTTHLGREQALLRTKNLLEGVLDSLPQCIAWKNEHSVYLGANLAFLEKAGLPDVRALLGRDASAFASNGLVTRSAASDAKVLGGQIALRNVEEAHPDQPDSWIARSQLPLSDGEDKVIGIVDSFEDITTRKQSELAMRLRIRALDASVNAILISRATPEGNLIEYVNPAFERMTGYSTSEVLGRSCTFLHGEDRAQRGIDQIATAMSNGTEVSAILRNYRKDGSRFWNKLYIAPIRELGGNATHYVGVLTDVTELIQYQEQLERQANFDTLTQLPNRSLLGNRLIKALAEAELRGSSVAVLFLDLDLFKNVNDSLGHNVGDRLLQSISERLVSCVRDTDTVARYGGDEFVVVLPHPEGVDVPALLSRILGAVSEPVFVDEHELYVEASIGVSCYPADGDTPDVLLKKADAAMYLAKERGRNNFQFYHTELDAEVVERLALSNRFRKAARTNELTVHYQPQVDMRTGQVVGAEALLRWFDPELGAISPASFIPLAEESGLIVKIGEFVLRTACEQLNTWDAQGLAPVRMSVNVSPQQIMRSNFLSTVQAVLGETGVNPSRLELEMTESTLMSNASEAALLLDSLRKLGIHVSIDDFGTGYSSLSYLKKFRVDRIKIDRTFVRDIGEDGDDEVITRAMIALARTLEVGVIAEGVETEQQRDFLLRHGCAEAQGFLYSPAVAPEVLAEKMASSVTAEAVVDEAS